MSFVLFSSNVNASYCLLVFRQMK